MHYSIKHHSSAFPIRCAECSHSVNITTGLPVDFTTQPENWNLHDQGPVALDCEMVGVGPKMSNALGRITIVDFSGNVLYDVMVRPEEDITDFRTRWSGIRPIDMRRAIPFEYVREQVERIIQNRIVVGHMIQNDFAVLHLKHPAHLIRDTARAPYAKLVAGFPTKHVVGLRALTLRLFGVRIQSGEHCSLEDARATMAIYRLVRDEWEADLANKAKSPGKRNKSKCRQPPTDPLNSTVCETSASPQNTVTLKRLVSETAQSVPDLELDVKRRCHSLPSSVTLGLTKSASSASLLDDEFWPDEPEELII